MSKEPISWSTAQRVAARVARDEPFSASYLRSSLDDDFETLTREAEQIVLDQTGLVADGPARIRVIDRDAWAAVNVASFRRTLRPLTQRLGERMNDRLLAPITSRMTGTQLGLVLGWMSGRVLGQYDPLLAQDERPEQQDMLYYVGPNVLALEKRYAFPPQEFRLWLAVHECTHRAQFTGVPWLTEYFKSLVTSILDSVEPDPKRLQDSLKQVVEQTRGGKEALAEGGLLSLFTTPEQQTSIRKVSALMSLLEGHGDVTMSAAGESRIPSAERFHRVMHERRSEAHGFAKIMQRLLGLDAKLKQYAQGEKFIRAVEDAKDQTFFRNVWHSPDTLPTFEEIREPQQWIDRMSIAVL